MENCEKCLKEKKRKVIFRNKILVRMDLLIYLKNTSWWNLMKVAFVQFFFILYYYASSFVGRFLLQPKMIDLGSMLA